jgi:hypothetical protein
MLATQGVRRMKLTGKRLLLILLYAPANGKTLNVPITGRTRLMKMVFLFEKELLESFQQDSDIEDVDLPDFYAWRYGPFSAKLLDDLEFLVNRGFISLAEGGSPSPQELDEYTHWLDEFGETFVGDYVHGDTVAGEFVQESFALTADKGCAKAAELWEQLSPKQRSLISGFKERFANTSLDRILEYVYKTYEEYTDLSLIRERYS